MEDNMERFCSLAPRNNICMLGFPAKGFLCDKNIIFCGNYWRVTNKNISELKNADYQELSLWFDNKKPYSFSLNDIHWLRSPNVLEMCLDKLFEKVQVIFRWCYAKTEGKQ